ncbi:hypothetical protein [Agrococcus baldri]|uniref:Ig-like domain-containing protein n=1 Tax=Agrococcus baldri TaxID=153730 RepID=A0AA87URI6_9MICO|nr:hypothetical protein [Agrococcus baldri]GEK79500.1 hypothetical protein ABA31_08510 [Agrococcus baldri]
MSARRICRRLLAGTIALAVAAALLWAPRAAVSDAAWIDPENSSAALTAIALQPPQSTAVTLCKRPGLTETGNAFSIQWRWPASMPSPPAEAATTWTINGVALVPVTSGPVAGVYTSTFTVAQLRSVTTPVVERTYTARASTRLAIPGGSAWTSATHRMAQMVAPAVAGDPTCQVLAGP